MISVSVDVMKCSILEPNPFTSSWYFHNFNGTDFRYEVEVSCMTAKIV